MRVVYAGVRELSSFNTDSSVRSLSNVSLTSVTHYFSTSSFACRDIISGLVTSDLKFKYALSAITSYGSIKDLLLSTISITPDF